ncbi:unnamed protein product [Sphagnum jensenii]|uniref:Uncharacterized protein n=1 Tax=Sphagnum jensenii TaxID=128206 RepID=A0ABP0VEX1_9BRYO
MREISICRPSAVMAVSTGGAATSCPQLRRSGGIFYASELLDDTDGRRNYGIHQPRLFQGKVYELQLEPKSRPHISGFAAASAAVV